MTPADDPTAMFAGKYRLVRLLGKGAMGEVWLAIEEGPRNFRRQVAVKRLLATSDLSDYARESFVAEAQVIARLDHPNIVRLVELGETSDDHSLYLVLDFVDGAALDRLIKKGGALSPGAVALLGREVARALDAVHSMADEAGNNYGVVHRDVSPANILISRDGRIRLSDFGVARISGLGGDKTETGVFKGKLPYMPPEQAGGQPFDGRADCFSLGVTLFEALLGGRLRRAETQGQLIAMIVTEQAPRVRERVPDAPEHLAYAIDYATVFQPEQRVRSAGELAVLLDDALRALGPRAEIDAITEIRERVILASDSSIGGPRTPWSMAISGSHPQPTSSQQSGSYPSAGVASGSQPSGSYPVLAGSQLAGSQLAGSQLAGSQLAGSPPTGAQRIATGDSSGAHRFGVSASSGVFHDTDAVATITGSGVHAPNSPRAMPPSVPSGAFNAGGSMAGPLDPDAGRPPRRNLGTTIAVVAGVAAVGIGAVLFFATQPGTTNGSDRAASTALPATPPSVALAPSATAEPTSPPAASADPAGTASPSADSSSSPATGPRAPYSPRPRPPATASATAAAVDDATPGTLQVIVIPWGNVSVDGKSYGSTPIAPVSLSPGTHTVVVTNSDLGAQRSATVRILPGKPNAVKFDLKKVD